MTPRRHCASGRHGHRAVPDFFLGDSVLRATLDAPHLSGCKEPVNYPAKCSRIFSIDPEFFDGVTLYRGRGCERCKNTGYAGRMAIIEAMTVTDEIRKLVIKQPARWKSARSPSSKG